MQIDEALDRSMKKLETDLDSFKKASGQSTPDAVADFTEAFISRGRQTLERLEGAARPKQEARVYRLIIGACEAAAASSPDEIRGRYDELATHWSLALELRQLTDDEPPARRSMVTLDQQRRTPKPVLPKRRRSSRTAFTSADRTPGPNAGASRAFDPKTRPKHQE